jgi:CheY-like chemotaxis protein
MAIREQLAVDFEGVGGRTYESPQHASKHEATRCETVSYLLLADDNEDMRLMLRDLFRAAGHEITMVPDGLSALAAIEEREPDLVILDHAMPGLTGIEVCRRVKQNPFTSRIPVLMLTAQGAVESKVEGFAAGADDYLSKPFDPRELRARVQALLRLVQREGDRNPTSGLPGGRAIEQDIIQRVNRGEMFAVCYLDLDNFKPFADTFGFAIADDVIRGLGTGIREAVASAGTDGKRARSSPSTDGESQSKTPDFVGHIGGDDFVVITSQERAEEVVRECTRACRAVVEGAVGEEAAREGAFVGVDREGQVRRFPLALVSCAVLHVRPEAWINLAHLGMRAAEVKRRAKQRGPGSVLVESA